MLPLAQMMPYPGKGCSGSGETSSLGRTGEAGPALGDRNVSRSAPQSPLPSPRTQPREPAEGGSAGPARRPATSSRDGGGGERAQQLCGRT